jgi:ureidoacrylate peracid hydrolase
MQHINEDSTTPGQSDVTVDPDRTALVLVVMQDCFVAGSLVSATLGPEVATRLNRLAGACRASGVAVVWTRHVVRPDGSKVGLLGETIPAVAHGVNEDAPTAALNEMRDVRPSDIVLGKPPIRKLLRHRPRSDPSLERNRHHHPGGINTNVCVDTTAPEAAARSSAFCSSATARRTSICPTAGSARASAEQLRRAARAVTAFGFADVVSVEEVLDRIQV